MNIRFVRSKVISLGMITALIFSAFGFITPTKAQTAIPNVPGPFTSPQRPLTRLHRFNRLAQYSPTNAPILRVGSRGPAVRSVQAFLQNQGLYRGAVDGIYGPQTAFSVRAFQQRYASLSNDGVIGQNTWRVIIDTVS